MKTIEFSKCFAYSLTTGIDGVSGGTNFTGGADNDIFNAVDDVIAATWTALDKIDGGAGNNTFNVSHTGEHFHVVAGTTLGMMLANVPVVWLGDAITRRVPLRMVHIVSAVIFMLLGLAALLGGA